MSMYKKIYCKNEKAYRLWYDKANAEFRFDDEPTEVKDVLRDHVEDYYDEKLPHIIKNMNSMIKDVHICRKCGNPFWKSYMQRDIINHNHFCESCLISLGSSVDPDRQYEEMLKRERLTYDKTHGYICELDTNTMSYKLVSNSIEDVVRNTSVYLGTKETITLFEIKAFGLNDLEYIEHKIKILNKRISNCYKLCKDCGKLFYFPENEKFWFVYRGLEIPKRCPQCRKKQKNRFNSYNHK